MYINKVLFDGKTLIDLTSDTVTADTLEEGVTAHAADGSAIIGKSAGTKGDMLKADYDPSSTVQEAGGIAAYVSGAAAPIQSELAHGRYVGVVLRPENWQGSGELYTYTISVPGVTADFVPGIPWHAIWPELAEDDLRHRLEEMAKIYKIETADGSMTFTAKEKPDWALDLCIPGEVNSYIWKSDYQ